MIRRMIWEKRWKKLHTKAIQESNWSMHCRGGDVHSPQLQVSVVGMSEISGKQMNPSYFLLFEIE